MENRVPNRIPTDQVHRTSEEGFQLLLQSEILEKRSLRMILLESDQQIDITARDIPTLRRRPEHFEPFDMKQPT